MDLATFLCVSLLWLITDVAVVIFTAFQGRFEATDVQRLFVLSFTRTYFDLWVVGLLRVCALAYWVVVVTQSARRSQGTPNYVSNVVKVTMLMTWMFAGIKVLAFAENEEVLADRLTAAILGWTWVACVVNYVGVHIIQGRPIKRRYIRLPSASGSDSGERQKLLSSSPKPTPDSEINQDSATGGEILVPYFVDRTINSLVMVKSQAVFRTALVRLVLVIVTS
ncbi:hypothetical protein BaRGS_00037362 [Batillaria attramentaria]|uniref:Uncharacterized protein n=1 Tax=Batillaria attramentaria TaxID=370345 RepID=A0ABD0J9B5_9CAEN